MWLRKRIVLITILTLLIIAILTYGFVFVKAQGISTDIEYSSGSGSSIIFVNQPLQLVEIATGGTPPYSYQWFVNEEKVSGANNSNFTFVESFAGQYNVACEVTDSLGNEGGLSPLPMFITVANPESSSPSQSPVSSITPLPSKTATSPNIPEFPALAILPLLLSMFAVAVILRHRKIANLNQ